MLISAKTCSNIDATHEEECKVEVCQGRPCEEELDCVVDELHLEEELPEEALPRRQDTEPEDSGMDRGEQRAVQPTTTLRDELGNLDRGVSRGTSCSILKHAP